MKRLVYLVVALVLVGSGVLRTEDVAKLKMRVTLVLVDKDDPKLEGIYRFGVCTRENAPVSQAIECLKKSKDVKLVYRKDGDFRVVRIEPL